MSRLHTHSLCRALLLTVALIAALACAAASAGAPSRPTIGIKVTRGALPQSRQVAPLPRVGQWVHGAMEEMDGAFFSRQDAAHEAWQLRKRDLLERAAAAAGEVGDDPSATRRPNHGGTGGEPAAGVGGAAAATFFAPGMPRKRKAALGEVLSPTSPHPLDEKLAAVLAQVHALRDGVEALSMDRSATSFAGDVYVPLVEHCYSHTVSATPGLSLLPRPLVADGRIIKIGRAEAAQLAEVFAPGGPLADAAGTAEGTRAREVLDGVTNLLDRSEAAVENVLALSRPLYLDGIAAAAAELQAVRRLMVDNDESTEVLQKEMRQLARAKARLQKWENELRAAYGGVRLAATAQQVDAKRLPMESVVAVGLTLIANLRLGCASDLPLLSVLPPPPTATALTGLVRADVLSEKRQPLHLLLFFACMVIGLRELRLWALGAARRTSPLRQATQRSMANKVLRQLFHLFSLGLSALPTLWVAGAFARLSFSKTAFFACITVAQRIGVSAAIVAAVAGTTGLARLLCMLPSFLDDPLAKVHAKKAE